MSTWEKLLQQHTDQRVEARSREVEAFILAQLRVTNLKPADFVLECRRSTDGLTESWRVVFRP